MIELHANQLIFSFPEIGAQIEIPARAWIDARDTTAAREEKATLPSGSKLYSRFAACLRKATAAIS